MVEFFIVLGFVVVVVAIIEIVYNKYVDKEVNEVMTKVEQQLNSKE